MPHADAVGADERDVDAQRVQHAQRLLADGQGIAWLSQRIVERELASGELRHLQVQDLQIERDLHVLWRQGASLSPAPAAFLALSGVTEQPDSNIKIF